MTSYMLRTPSGTFKLDKVLDPRSKNGSSKICERQIAYHILQILKRLSPTIFTRSILVSCLISLKISPILISVCQIMELHDQINFDTTQLYHFYPYNWGILYVIIGIRNLGKHVNLLKSITLK